MLRQWKDSIVNLCQYLNLKVDVIGQVGGLQAGYRLPVCSKPVHFTKYSTMLNLYVTRMYCLIPVCVRETPDSKLIVCGAGNEPGIPLCE